VKKKILITGSEGFIGKHLIKFFSKKNYLVFGSYYKKKNFYFSKNVKYLKCDVRDFQRLKEIILKIEPDIIFHLAAKSHPNFSFKNPIETLNTNTRGTINLLEICRKFCKNAKIILACSSAQYGSRAFNKLPMKESDSNMPEHIYGLSKVFQDKLGEQYNKMYSLKIIRAILFNTSGPGKFNDVFNDICSQFVKNNKKNKIIVNCGNLNNKRDFMHVDDVVNALYILALNGKSGESYNVGSGKLTKVREIINTLEVLYNRKINVRIYKSLYRKFDERFILSSNTKIRSLNWKPNKNIKDIIKDMVSYYTLIKT
jgi:GDP-4-dehydro-6-deoxy-D-mannose reductase